MGLFLFETKKRLFAIFPLYSLLVLSFRICCKLFSINGGYGVCIQNAVDLWANRDRFLCLLRERCRGHFSEERFMSPHTNPNFFA